MQTVDYLPNSDTESYTNEEYPQELQQSQDFYNDEDYQGNYHHQQEGEEGSEQMENYPHIVDLESFFVAELLDGYSFRNLIEYLRATNTTGNFRFGKDGIFYEQADASVTVVNQFEIHTHELIHYEFSSRNEEIIVGVNITDMRSVTKTIGKKDSVRIYKKANDPILYIQTMGNLERSNERANMSTVRPHKLEVVYYDFPEYSRGEKNPNCIVQASVFSKACAATSSIKCRSVVITGTGKGLILKAMMENGIVGRIENLGETGYNGSEYSESKIIQSSSNGLKLRLNVRSPTESLDMKVKSTTIKALSKLNNLSPSGMVKIYTQPGNPLKLSCKIGTYGILNIYIRAIRED